MFIALLFISNLFYGQRSFDVWHSRAFIMEVNESSGQISLLIHDEPATSEADATAKALDWCSNGLTLPQTEELNFTGIRVYPVRTINRCDTYKAS